MYVFSLNDYSCNFNNCRCRYHAHSSIDRNSQINNVGDITKCLQDISALCQALESLEVLNLTNNTMENDIVESPMLENIRILVLNNCGVTWELVYTHSCHFEAFLISANHIKS